jgi:hypothetical protein
MIIKEETRDLFTVDKDVSLVFTIAKDFRMLKGMPAKMNNRYKAMQVTVKNGYKKAKDPELRCIGFKPLHEERYIYNLIVKNKFNDKCVYDDLFEALVQLKDDMAVMDVKRIAMPKLCIGDDGLNWGKVRETIELAFGDTDVEIVVCCSPLDKDNPVD